MNDDLIASCFEQGLNAVCMTNEDFGLAMAITGILCGFSFMLISFLIITNVKA